MNNSNQPTKGSDLNVSPLAPPRFPFSLTPTEAGEKASQFRSQLQSTILSIMPGVLTTEDVNILAIVLFYVAEEYLAYHLKGLKRDQVNRTDLLLLADEAMNFSRERLLKRDGLTLEEAIRALSQDSKKAA